MITVEYKTNIIETTNATLDFLSRRPIMWALINLMRVCCVIICVAYVIKTTTSALTIHDTMVVLFALIWLFGQRNINAQLLKRKLKLQRVSDMENKYQISKHKLSWLTPLQKIAMQQPWKQIKYIYQNKDGYIVPAPGKENTGKFIWLPKRGFANQQAEQDFLELVKSLAIKLK